MTDEDYARETADERRARLLADARETVTATRHALRRAKRDGFDGVLDGAGVRVDLKEIARRADISATELAQIGVPNALAARILADDLALAANDVSR
mgnify:CR=1 FL=1